MLETLQDRVQDQPVEVIVAVLLVILAIKVAAAALKLVFVAVAVLVALHLTGVYDLPYDKSDLPTVEIKR